MLVFVNFSHTYKLICSITFNKINFPSLFSHWNVLKSFKKCEGGKGLSNSDYLKRGRRKKWCYPVGKEREQGEDRCGGGRLGAWADEGQRSACGVRRSLSKCEGKCVYAAQCVSAASWVSHFSPLTHSHLSPSVNIYREKCTVICHALGCPAYALCIICMHCTSSFIYINALWACGEQMNVHSLERHYFAGITYTFFAPGNY